MAANTLLETTLRTEIGEANTTAEDAIALLETNLKSEIAAANTEIDGLKTFQTDTTPVIAELVTFKDDHSTVLTDIGTLQTDLDDAELKIESLEAITTALMPVASFWG